MPVPKEPEPRLLSEQRACLERLVASSTIARAPRLRLMLKFLVSSLIAGQADSISEQSIGQEVFGRPPGYNSSDDNIVRVSIRHLRGRLDEYYATEGAGDPWIFEIPKGKYVPQLVARAAPPAPAVEEAAPAANSVPTSEPRWRRPRLLAIVAVTAIAANLVLAAFLWRAHNNSAEHLPGLLPLLVQDGRQINIVVSDSDLMAYREIIRRQVPLDTYIDRSYSRPDHPPATPLEAGAWHYVAGTSETSVTCAIIAVTFQKASGNIGIEVKHPHDLSMRDVQRQSMILLGGPWINPWGQLFEKRLNFRIYPPEDHPDGSEIHNLSPAAGEQAVYSPHEVNGVSINYARVAVLPNFENTGHIVLLGATGLDSLEAAGAYLLDDKAAQDLFQHFHVTSLDRLPPFEVVLAVEGQGNVPDRVHVVALRAVSAGS